MPALCDNKYPERKASAEQSCYRTVLVSRQSAVAYGVVESDACRTRGVGYVNSIRAILD